MISSQTSRTIQWPVALPSCTVLVCTRRRPGELSRCLESLRKLRYPQFAILVIENDASSSEAEEIARANDAEYRLCTRRGLSAARNFGVRLCNTELIAFLDDDAICDPDWLSQAVPLFGDPGIFAVTGKISFHKDGGFASAASYEFDPGDRIVSGQSPDWFGMANFGGLGLGSNFIIRKSAWETVGGFDERLGRGSPLHCSEENDFLFRLLDSGMSVATRSQAIVRHPTPRPCNAEERIRSIASATVTVSMLAIEHPRHLLKLAKYLWGALTRKPQPWRDRPAHLFDNMASRKTVYSALARGPFIYLSATLNQIRQGTPHFLPSLEEPGYSSTSSEGVDLRAS